MPWNDRSLDSALDRKATLPMPRWFAWLLALLIVGGGYWCLRDELKPQSKAKPTRQNSVAPADR